MTGRHMRPVLVFIVHGCFLVSVVHVVNERKEHKALQGIRRTSTGFVQDPAISCGRPIIEGMRVFVDSIIGHLERGMSITEICQEDDLTPEEVKEVKQLRPEQVQYVKGFADVLENVVRLSTPSTPTICIGQRSRQDLQGYSSSAHFRGISLLSSSPLLC